MTRAGRYTRRLELHRTYPLVHSVCGQAFHVAASLPAYQIVRGLQGKAGFLGLLVYENGMEQTPEIEALIAAVKEFTPKPFSDDMAHTSVQNLVYYHPQPEWVMLRRQADEAERKDAIAKAAWDAVQSLSGKL